MLYLVTLLAPVNILAHLKELFLETMDKRTYNPSELGMLQDLDLFIGFLNDLYHFKVPLCLEELKDCKQFSVLRLALVLNGFLAN